MTTSTFRYRWLIGIALLISLPIMAWTINTALDGDKKAIAIPLPLLSTLRPEPLPLQDFTLTDQYGKPFTLERLSDKWTFVFFGYTFCPDICPTTLHEMSGIADMLARQKNARDVQFVFVSVDPQRDSVSVMKDYMDYFNPEFIGLTGRQADIDALTRQLNILTIRKPAGSSGDYQVNHTSSIMLIDPKRRWFASFSPPLNGKRIVEQFGMLQAHYRQSN